MIPVQTEQIEAFKDADVDIPIVNVLNPDQFRSEHIPQSMNIPFHTENFVQQVENIVDSKSDPVAVYCANESCDLSSKAAKALEEDGFTRVYDYEGGMEAWKQAQHDVESG